EAVQQRNVVGNIENIGVRHRFPRQQDDEHPASIGIDVGRGVPEPVDVLLDIHCCYRGTGRKKWAILPDNPHGSLLLWPTKLSAPPYQRPTAGTPTWDDGWEGSLSAPDLMAVERWVSRIVPVAPDFMAVERWVSRVV